MSVVLQASNNTLNRISGSVLGPLFFGIVAASMSYGIAGLHCFRYFARYPNDRPLERVAVASLWVLISIHLSLVLFLGYRCLIFAWGNPLALVLDPNIDVIRAFILTGILTTRFVHVLYGLKAWKLGRHVHPVFRCAVVAAVLTAQGTGLFTIIQIYERGQLADFIQLNTKVWDTSIYVMFSSSTGTDLILAILICYVLGRNRSQFPGTTSKISILTRYLITSGLLIAAFDLATLISHAALPRSFIFLGISLPTCSLYVNSYISLLNSRGSSTNHGLMGTLPHLPTAMPPMSVHIQSLEMSSISPSSSQNSEKPLHVIP